MLSLYLNNLINTIFVTNLYARAGGGGSGSDGGGGEFFALIGIGISYAINKPIKKLLPFNIAKIVSFILMLIITIFFIALWLLGASFVLGYITIMILIGLWVSWYNIMFDIWHKMRAKTDKANADIAKASQTDSIWNENNLHQVASAVFLAYQDDWTRLNNSRLHTYMTSYLAQKTEMFYQILRSLNRQNAVMDTEIIKMDTYEINDSPNNNQDSFTILIEARAKDMIINLGNNQVIYQDQKPFIEYWKFIRNGNSWLLADINQQTANAQTYKPEIYDFAVSNGMFYSLDMGWLFLPEHGQVFSSSSFGKADINNHAMGFINNILTQIYTYNSGIQNDITYVIGQITVPKYYGNILIKPKNKFFSLDSKSDVRPPYNSTKYSFEWSDFNNKYEVWATDGDRLPSFELVNPKFMEMLFNIDDKLVLEVTGNIIYFRSVLSSNAQTYNQLMLILKQAHKELKL
jgi:hypothetical protein